MNQKPKGKNWLKYLLFLLLLVPFITDYLEEGHFPETGRGYITEISIAILICFILFIVFRQFMMLERMSLVDHLTGISNRRQFEIDLNREIVRSHRIKLKLVLVFFDLDGFKYINDHFGHHTGDQVLVKFAECLSLFTRKGIDYCYRFGGDEFAVILTNISKNEEVDIEARIEKSFSETVVGKLPQGISVSRGVVILMENESFDEVLKRADAAMYAAKKAKK